MGESFIGRRVFITGSLQGIGLGIAESFAREGADLVLHGLGDLELISSVEKIIVAAGASKVESHISDLRDWQATEDLVKNIYHTGAVDILVNNAGIQHTANLAQMSRENWSDIIAINLSSYFDTMRLILPKMAEVGFGRVINIASVHGLVGSVAKAPYVAAKHGVVGLTKVAALEYAQCGSRESGGVTVNAICPGWVETALIEPQISSRLEKHNGVRSAAIADLLSEKEPSGRTSTPGEIGELALWLSSKAAHNVTGTAIAMDGGWTAQ